MASDAAADSLLVEVRSLDFDHPGRSPLLDGEQRYRQILVRAMGSEGFSNYHQEWWHFSYPLADAVPFDRVIRQCWSSLTFLRETRRLRRLTTLAPVGSLPNRMAV